MYGNLSDPELLMQCVSKTFNEIKFPTQVFVIGCDEVGRGPIAGPVMAASVGKLFVIKSLEDFKQKFQTLYNEWKGLGVCDSKKISATKRQKILRSFDIGKDFFCEGHLDQVFSKEDLFYYITQVSSGDIDRMNILQASLKSLRVSTEKIIEHLVTEGLLEPHHPIFWLVDGHILPPFLYEGIDARRLHKFTLRKGDGRSIFLGLASILAKEMRDSWMVKAHEDFPQYEFHKHKGYPTALHYEKVKTYGPSPIHRLSFRGVAQSASDRS